MNGIQYALKQIHSGENEMHQLLLHISETHHADHEVHFVTRDLAEWSAEHVRRIAEHAKHQDLDLDEDAATPSKAAEGVRAAVSVLSGHRPEPGLLLLHDLRSLYLQGSDNSLAWEMLAQIAQAQHERDLLSMTEDCHPQTLRQVRWANTMLKTQSPQILASI